MSDIEFAELVKYVSDHVEHDLDRYAMRMMDEMREGLPYVLEDAINDYAREWCEDNGYDEGEFFDNYDAEDVFMHDNYDFDAQ